MEGSTRVVNDKKLARRARLGMTSLLAVLLGAMILSGSALAAPAKKGSGIPPIVKPNIDVRQNGDTPDDIPPPVVRKSTTTVEEEGGGTLPFTGADLTLFAVTGAALIVTGSVVVRRTRARRVQSN